MTDDVEIVVDKGVPIPGPRGRAPKYPFAKMAVGDSFISEQDQKRVGSAASDYGRKNGMRFVTRKVLGGTRCWRTE